MTLQMEEEDARRKTTKAGLQKYTASKLGGLTTVWVGGLHGQMEEAGWLIKRFAVHGDVTAVTVRACGSVDTDEGPDHGSNEQRGSEKSIEKVGKMPFIDFT
eukprot:COSAG06_NODE_9967_length_1780_cov_1.164783_2_plen_102_part_00